MAIPLPFPSLYETTDYEDEKDSCQLMALNNYLILTNVFEYLPLKDLKNIRLVCKLWSEASTSVVQEKAVVKLNERTLYPEMSLSKFIEKFSLDDNRFHDGLFCNFKIQISWSKNEKLESLVEFWERFGSSIRNLYIDVAAKSLVACQFLRNAIFIWSPNMTKLVLRESTFYTGKDVNINEVPANDEEEDYTGDSVPINSNLVKLEFYGLAPMSESFVRWREIFRSYRNLKSLILQNIGMSEYYKILQIIKTQRRISFKNLNIEKLTIFNGDFATTEISDPVLTSLLDLGLNLTHLSFDIGININERLIGDFFQQQSKSLTSLKIYRGPMAFLRSGFPFQIVFPKVKSLQLTERVADSLDFIHFFPCLTSLAVCEPPELEPPLLPSDMVFKTESDLSNGQKGMLLRKLRIQYQVSCGDIRKLVNWFPNVRSIQLFLDNESFRIVCGELPYLEEMEIIGDQVDDEGITGARITQEGNIIRRSEMNILHLKRLKTFIMTNFSLSTQLSDFSIQFGFVKMSSLARLEICSEHITEEGWSALHNMSTLQTLIPKDGRWKHTDCDNFAKPVYAS